MRMLMRICAGSGLSLILYAGPAAADPVEGVWKTQPSDKGDYAHVTVSTCGAQICGVLSQAFDSAGNPLNSDKVGRKMRWDMQPNGQGAYSGGKIWAPDRDKTYRSKMTLSGNVLSVSGCVGPICRGQDWTRVK